MCFRMVLYYIMLFSSFNTDIRSSSSKGIRKFYRFNDAVTSINCGLMQSTIKVLCRSVEFSICCYIYDNYALVHLPWHLTSTWIIAFLLVDFLYYWGHRAVHEVNFLWAFHQTHHSSECYNLSTALRQNMIIQFTSVFFNIPSSLILPPQVHLVHLSLNLLYQFWIHTKVITHLGPLEYIINTPSHHRVHHGRNRYCIDKNYAGTLIIWDRMFGTFEWERAEEPVVYGLVHNVETFDQLYIQLYYFKYIFYDKLRSVATFGEKMKAVWYGPGWFPGKPRTGELSDIPDIEEPVKVYDPPISSAKSFYVLFHNIFVLFMFLDFSIGREDLTFFASLMPVFLITFSLESLSWILDNKWYAKYPEVVRCLLVLYLDVYSNWMFNVAHRLTAILSISFWLLIEPDYKI